MSKELKIDKAYLHEMYNATCKESPEGSDEIESYENWLERQLISRITTTTKTAAGNYPMNCERCSELLRQRNNIEDRYLALKNKYEPAILPERYSPKYSHPQPTEVTEGMIDKIALERFPISVLSNGKDCMLHNRDVYSEGIRKGLSMKGGGEEVKVELSNITHIDNGYSCGQCGKFIKE